ncbi:MAG: 3-isopropylmalate dehydratase large subunit [Thermoplasmata archaeon]
MSRPQTQIERILSRHSTEAPGKPVEPEEFVEVEVDRLVLIDMAATHPEFLSHLPHQVYRPDRVAWVFDHLIPAPTVELASGLVKLRELARRWGITNVFDIGRGGISHPLMAEKGWVRPGEILANTDSHTCATGALGCAGRGVGMLEVMSILATGRTWYRVGETIRAELNGRLSPGVAGKDVFLSLAADHGAIPGRNIEFAGDGIPDLPIPTRQVIATMCAELSAEFALFPADRRVLDYVRARVAPGEPVEPVSADPDASYLEEWTVDLARVEPLVALPGRVARNVRPVSEMESTPITRAVVGSCANGTIEDLEAVADVLRGRHVHPDVVFTVTPHTSEVMAEASRRGLIDAILSAGALLTNPTCGSCFGGHMGVLGDGEVCVTSTTRNFQGRMGSPSAKIYLASSATVAASAVEGHLTDPRRVLGGRP